MVDEDAAKESLKAEGIEARGLADALAELKAISVSRRHAGRIVIGSDSIVELADGMMLDKPDSRARAAEQLRMMRDGTHRLVSAVVAARDGVPVWRRCRYRQAACARLLGCIRRNLSRCRMAGDRGLRRLLPDRGAGGAAIHEGRGQPVHDFGNAVAAAARLAARCWRDGGMNRHLRLPGLDPGSRFFFKRCVGSGIPDRVRDDGGRANG